MNHRYPINFINQNNDQPEGEEARIKKNKKIIYLILAVSFLILLGGCLSRNLWSDSTPVDPAAYDPITLKPKAPDNLLGKISHYLFSRDNLLKGNNQDRINILIYGIGGLGHDGPYLTDTIILASIKPSTGQVALISLPRDLAVDIPGYGIKKINNANAYGEVNKKGSGPEFATNIIKDTFDLDIPYYYLIDFKAFEEIVDELGGVKITVDRAFTDQMYPTDNYEYQTVSFEKGTQNMDGQTALKFARSRHGSNGEGSDFARSRRQQKIIFAVKEKIISFGTLSNPFTISKIINTLSNHLQTNLDFGEIIEFVRLARILDTKNIINLTLDDSPNGYLKNSYGPDGAFLLEPKTGNFDTIKESIKNIFEEGKTNTDNTPSQEAPNYKTSGIEIEIQNGTWHAGMAARMKKRLEDKNFVITTIGNTEFRPQATSGIYLTSDKNSYEVSTALEQELHLAIRRTLPTNVKPATSTDILLLLGDDLDE